MNSTKSFYLLVGILVAWLLFAVACGDSIDTTPGSGNDWKLTKHDNAITNGITLTEQRPAEHRTPRGVRVYWDGTVSQKQMQVIDNGISRMLTNCLRDTNQWEPSDLWRSFKNFNKHTDFNVILIPSTYRSQADDVRGCPLMGIGVWGNYTSTCGTISAVTIVNGKPVQRGGAYLILPFQDDDREICWQLAETCVANEGEHQIFINKPDLFMSFANDYQPPNGVGHPYCVGMVE